MCHHPSVPELNVLVHLCLKPVYVTMKAQGHTVINVKRPIVSTETAGYDMVSVILRVAVMFTVVEAPLTDVVVPLANHEAPCNVKLSLMS
jgi:hypothetical protein